MEDYNSSAPDYDNSSNSELNLINTVVDYIVSCGIPLSAVAVYGLYSLVRNNRAPAPVYIINLLISDIIQICSIIVILSSFKYLSNPVLDHMYFFCLLTSVAFMACIALERYLLVAWPLWYRFERPTMIAVVVSVLVWIVCAVISVVLYSHDFELSLSIYGIFLLLPSPLFIFCLCGTLRALSSCRLPADEKQRIVVVLVLVLLIYTLLFLPVIFTLLLERLFELDVLPFMLVRLNPLADSVLYIFMQKEAVDKLLASVCCCKSNSNDISISNV